MTATAALLPGLLLLLASGPTAQGAECFPACHPQNGFCGDDNVCRCQPGWQGPLCDQCMTFPGCAHGLCVDPWECVCEEGWEGDLCDTDIRACSSAPCANNGTCVNMEKGSYQCSCAPGFSGRHCTSRDGPCVVNGSSCQHGGTCVDQDGRASHVSCLCLPGFAGNFCELVVAVADSCTPNPCENKGICTDIGGDFRCRCPAGFMDKTCSRPVGPCAAGPCQNGGTCLQHSQGQAICFTVLGVLAGLLLLGTMSVVFFHKCQPWVARMRRRRRLLLAKKQNPLLHYSSGDDDLAVNIIFPDKTTDGAAAAATNIALVPAVEEEEM
ncbi:protein delta homolog 1 isoform X2 [Suncus etruscus]|uniref:protein delta homolog 1 isoform X2 n=1 Tax=Suncus etruscus TaxID=109475 RepID=UPI00211040A1|nr:protein delta homolog 1 isoform X2 [Suncus etruscus]